MVKSIGDTVRGATSQAVQGSISAVGIGQDDIIFAMVLFAFVVWITTKGELPKYLSFFIPGATQGPPTSPVTATPATGAATNPAGAFGGATSAGGATGVVGQILNPSTDPIAGPISKALGSIGKFLLPGSALGLGN
jgi:hypothetical protein